MDNVLFAGMRSAGWSRNDIGKFKKVVEENKKKNGKIVGGNVDFLEVNVKFKNGAKISLNKKED